MLAVIRTRGYPPPAGVRLISLSTAQFAVLQHASRRIVAPDRVGDSSIPSPDDLAVAPFIDGLLARMPERARRDLGRFLLYVEHLAPIAAGSIDRFTRLGPEGQDRVLASVQTSSNDLLRAGFDGLRSLVFWAYYRDPRTWAIIGYDGPLVGRPATGWR